MSSILEELNTLSLPAAGHWHKRKSNVPRYTFGKGAKKDFTWYFKGDSAVRTKSVRDICRWLTRCKYLSDEALFVEDDFWQHPVTFEHLRKGDCEDHALWAWRKLLEIHVDAEFVCGQWLERNDSGEIVETGHAWVNFKDPKTHRWHVLESTEKNLRLMVLHLDAAEKMYFPEVAINGNLETYRYSVSKGRRRA